MNTHPLARTRSVLAAAALSASLLAAHGALAQPPSIPPAALQNAGAARPGVDIHDIRGHKPIASPWLIPMLAMTALLALGGSYAAWTWNRRRYREACKGPLDVALERLDKARSLMVPTRGREFSIDVSSVVRDYIESRFNLRAAHMTTHEFLHQLLDPAASVLSAHRSLLDNFLESCDLAKFGGWNLAPADMEAMLDSARRFIVAAAGASEARRTPSTAGVAAAHSSTSAPGETYVSLPST